MACVAMAHTGAMVLVYKAGWNGKIMVDLFTSATDSLREDRREFREVDAYVNVSSFTYKVREDFPELDAERLEDAARELGWDESYPLEWW